MKLSESQFTLRLPSEDSYTPDLNRVYIGTSQVEEIRPVPNRPEVVRLVGPELGLTFISSYEVPQEVYDALAAIAWYWAALTGEEF